MRNSTATKRDACEAHEASSRGEGGDHLRYREGSEDVGHRLNSEPDERRVEAVRQFDELARQVELEDGTERPDVRSGRPSRLVP